MKTKICSITRINILFVSNCGIHKITKFSIIFILGQAERIKKFPSPRQFASTAFVFNVILIILLPLGLVNEFAKLGDWGIWTSIPFCVVIGWIYIVMELVGDYTENPFGGLMFDVPMLSICRTIEIDVLQMVGDEDLPEAIASKNGVLV